MGESKRSISRAEAHELVETTVTKAIREVTWLMAEFIFFFTLR